MDTNVPAEILADQSESSRTGDALVRTAPNRPGDAAGGRRQGRRDDPGGRPVADRREVERLEAELERKEEQLRCVTEQYEHLLAKKNRKLAEGSDADAGSEERSTLRSRLSRFLSSLR